MQNIRVTFLNFHTIAKSRNSIDEKLSNLVTLIDIFVARWQRLGIQKNVNKMSRGDLRLIRLRAV
jgi:hypothetical protein